MTNIDNDDLRQASKIRTIGRRSGLTRPAGRHRLPGIPTSAATGWRGLDRSRGLRRPQRSLRPAPAKALRPGRIGTPQDRRGRTAGAIGSRSGTSSRRSLRTFCPGRRLICLESSTRYAPSRDADLPGLRRPGNPGRRNPALPKQQLLLLRWRPHTVLRRQDHPPGRRSRRAPSHHRQCPPLVVQSGCISLRGSSCR